MQIFERLSIGTKLWFSVGFIVVALALLIASTAARSQRLTAESDLALKQMNEKVTLATRWAALAEVTMTRVQAEVVSGSPEIAAMYKDLIPAGSRTITEIQDQVAAMDLTPSERTLFDRIVRERQVTREALTAAREANRLGDVEGARRVINERFNPSIPPYLASLDEFTQLQRTMLIEAQSSIAERRNANMRTATAWTFALLLGIVVGAYFLIRHIRDPLNEAVGFAKQISTGDLTVHLQTTRSDEFGTMLQALENMRTHLALVVADVRTGTDNITVAAREVASGSQSLSMRTEQAASNLQETTASMEQMSVAIQESAESSRLAQQLSMTAGKSAEQGGKVVGDVVRTMEEINLASRKINDIISVINGIAFQTNILALNAAVEAARAGEQGRGFAVVAGEVRTLAQRSAEAAKEIKQLIDNSVGRVTAGMELVQQAGATMQEIVADVDKVRSIIEQSAGSVTEQASGVQQINTAIGNLDQLTQQNAALVEQSAAAAASMSEQAEQLAHVVQSFRIDPSSAAAPRQGAAAAPKPPQAPPRAPQARSPLLPMSQKLSRPALAQS